MRRRERDALVSPRFAHVKNVHMALKLSRGKAVDVSSWERGGPGGDCYVQPEGVDAGLDFYDASRGALMLSCGRPIGSGEVYVADDLRFARPELLRSKGIDPLGYECVWYERKRVSMRQKPR